MEWTPRGEWVELIINGEHLGNYYLCEKIEVDNSRVNISKNGGFLLEIDNLYDKDPKFYSEVYKYPYMIKYPENITERQFDYIFHFINGLEYSLKDSVSFSNRCYNEFLDIASFIDFWLVYEICANWEPNGPRSCYAYKEIDGKLEMGPVWDFDLQTFIPDHYTGRFPIINALYYSRLFQDELFVSELKKGGMGNGIH